MKITKKIAVFNVYDANGRNLKHVVQTFNNFNNAVGWMQRSVDSYGKLTPDSHSFMDIKHMLARLSGYVGNVYIDTWIADYDTAEEQIPNAFDEPQDVRDARVGIADVVKEVMSIKGYIDPSAPLGDQIAICEEDVAAIMNAINEKYNISIQNAPDIYTWSIDEVVKLVTEALHKVDASRAA